MTKLAENTIRRLSEYGVEVTDSGGVKRPFQTNLGLGDLCLDELYLVMLTVQALHHRGRLKEAK